MSEKMPSKAKILEYNRGLLEGFIKMSPTFNMGCILIGFHDTGDATQVNVSAGTSKNNMYRAAGAILESLVADQKIEDNSEAALVKKLTEVIRELSGDGESIPEVLSFERGIEVLGKKH